MIVKILLFCVSLFAMTGMSYASWNIGSKGRANGPTIHTTYFLTSNNAAFPVKAQAYVGNWVNGVCQYNVIYNMGTETLKTGDSIDFDGFSLKSVAGGGYTCMTLYYTYQQLVVETFQLIWDGVNYYTSIPPTSEVTIL